MIDMANRLEALDAAVREERRRGHTFRVVSLRRLRRTPDLTATAIIQAINKRALVLVGIGIAIGSALGGAGFELARRVIVSAWPGLQHVP